MNEKELCKFINENIFKKTLNTWHTFIINTSKGRMSIEVLIPTKGNVKLRKPIKKVVNDDYDYTVYRITKNNTLYDMGIFQATRPTDSEVFEFSI